MNSPIETQKALTPQESDQLFEGIVLGRTLHQLEKALGIKAERLLSLIRRDEGAALGFKEAREVSAFVIEDEVTEKLRLNAEEPASAVQNNALKLWADHMRWVAERRNAAIYSGKAPVNVSVPIQIVTSLDLGQQKTLEGVYDLTATSITEIPAADIPPEAFDPVAIERGNPFLGAASSPKSAEAGQKGRKVSQKQGKAGPEQAGRRDGVEKTAGIRRKRDTGAAPSQMEGEVAREKGHRARKDAPKRGRAAEAQA